MKQILFALLFIVGCRAVHQKPPVFRIEGDEMILSLERDWNKHTIDSILTQYDMRRLSVDTAWRFGSAGQLAAEGWLVRRQGKTTIEVYESKREAPAIDLIGVPLCIDPTLEPGSISQPIINVFTDRAFGTNEFRNTSVTEINDSVTQFRLRGYPDARQVMLSGSFNSWTTSGLPMTRTADGWQTFVRIVEGRHEYKFIVDGKWIRDPDNSQVTPDHAGDNNSVYFKTNFTFTLNGYPKAKRVVLSGSFNGWNERELAMQHIGDRWVLDVFLPNGTYTYKFIVDGNWITDPGNPETRPDGVGNTNSWISMGEPTVFTLEGQQQARQVILTGTFNGWAETGLVMVRMDRRWELPVVLQPGVHQYKFIVDGRWVVDENQPIVPSDIPGERNNYVVIEPNHRFILKDYLTASHVFVTGSFIDWREPGFELRHSDDRWELPFHLSSGKHTYKYIVDGQWILDPGNTSWEDNEFGTGNSVVWLR